MFDSLLKISPRHALIFCLLLSCFELITYMGSDIIMPGMLSVVDYFNANKRYVPLSLNAYLLGEIAFQWLIGPLSDRFGRRPLLLIGCAGFMIACLLTPWATTIDLFILLRFIQGIGLGFVIVVGYPALQEGFKESDAIRLVAIFSNIGLISPLIGPIIGSIIISLSISWKVLFIIIAFLSLLVWLGLFWLMPETIGVLRKDGSMIALQPLKFSSIANSYVDLLKNKRFMFGIIALGLISLPLINWIALSPLLLMHNLNMNNGQYALWQIPVFCGLIMGNISLNFIAKKFKIEQLLFLSLFPTFGGLVIALIATLIFNHVIALVIGLACYTFGLSICYATLYRITLYCSDKGKGTVSAMIGMLSMAILASGSILLAYSGAGDSLIAYIIPVATVTLMAILPIIYVVFYKQQVKANLIN